MSPLDSQLVIVPVYLLIVAAFTVAILDLESAIRRRLREDDPGSPIISLPSRRRRWRRRPARDFNADLQRALLERARPRMEGSGF